MRRARRIALIVLSVVAALMVGSFAALQTGFARDRIRTLLAEATAGTSVMVDVDRIEGVVPFDMQVAGLRLSDRDGVWLASDAVKLDWSPAALLAGRLQINALAANTIDLRRAPAAQPSEEPVEPGPLIPELPFDIDLRRLTVDQVTLAPAILGEPAAFSIAAHAKLGTIGDGLSASLSLQQLSGNTGTAQIDLAYRPREDALTLNGAVQEPHGGVLGRLLGLPQGSNLAVTLAGDGPLARWHGRARATLDGAALLELDADVQGQAARQVTFNLHAAPDVLLEPELRALVAGGVEAAGSLALPPDRRTIGVSGLAIRTAAGALRASGTLGLHEDGDLAITVDMPDSQPFAALAPDVSWSDVVLQARLQGSLDAPRLTGDLTVRELATADTRVGAGTIHVDAAVEGPDEPVALKGRLDLSTLSTPDPRLTAMLAKGLRLAFSGTADRTGAIAADRIDLNAGSIALTGSARAEQWGAAARNAEATLTLADLATLGSPAAGSAQVQLALGPAGEGERLEITGVANAMSLGQPMADRLVGSAPSLHLVLTGDIPRAFTIEEARLDGANVDVGASGTIADRTLDLTFATQLDDIGAIDPALNGQVTVDGTAWGSLDSPALVAEVNAPALGIAARRIEALKLEANASDLLGKPQIDVKGTARVERLAASIVTSVVRDGARITASDIALALGRSRLSGDVTAQDGLVSGALALEVPDLAEVASLAGTSLGGIVSAELALAAAEGQQNAELTMRGSAISATDAIKVQQLDLTSTMNNLFDAPDVTADLTLADGVISGVPLRRLSLAAAGPLSALQTKVAVDSPELSATAEAQLAQTEAGYRIGLQALAAKVRDIDIKSAKPAMFEIGADTTRIEDVALTIEDGSLVARGTVAPAMVDLSLTVKSLPVSLARVVAPDFPVTGRLDGEVEIKGPPDAPSGRFTIAGTDIGPRDVPQQQGALNVAGTLRQGALDVTGEVKPKAGGGLAFAATLPRLDPGANLEAKANGTLDLALVDAFLAGGADRIKGKAALDITARGTLGAPDVTGTLHLADAGYENLRYGIKLKGITAEVRASGPRIQVVSLTASTPGGGSVTGSGDVDLERGVETRITMQTRAATLVDTDLAHAVIDSDLTLAGNLQERLALEGAVKVVKAEIRVPDRLPASVQEIEVTEVNAPPRIADRIAARQAPPKEALAVALALMVEAPQQVAVRGRGLDVELGGKLKIGGTTAAPAIDGALQVRRGSLTIAARRLDFTEGTLTFEEGEQIDPMLDLTAVSRAEELQVTAKVEGPARAPRITLSSVPSMPEDEILARLLFGKSAGALGPFELVQLAQATADLAGVSTGPGVLDKIRAGTGLDRLSLEQSDATTGPSLNAGRYVAEGVYVGVSQGTKSGSSAATVEIEVTPNVKIESEVGPATGGKAGVNLEWDY